MQERLTSDLEKTSQSNRQYPVKIDTRYEHKYYTISMLGPDGSLSDGMISLSIGTHLITCFHSLPK